MPTITTADGTDIFYKDWGTGQPIVFSHGWPLSADDWDTQPQKPRPSTPTCSRSSAAEPLRPALAGRGTSLIIDGRQGEVA